MAPAWPSTMSVWKISRLPALAGIHALDAAWLRLAGAGRPAPPARSGILVDHGAGDGAGGVGGEEPRALGDILRAGCPLERQIIEQGLVGVAARPAASSSVRGVAVRPGLMPTTRTFQSTDCAPSVCVNAIRAAIAVVVMMLFGFSHTPAVPMMLMMTPPSAARMRWQAIRLVSTAPSTLSDLGPRQSSGRAFSSGLRAMLPVALTSTSMRGGAASACAMDAGCDRSHATASTEPPHSSARLRAACHSFPVDLNQEC